MSGVQAKSGGAWAWAKWKQNTFKALASGDKKAKVSLEIWKHPYPIAVTVDQRALLRVSR